MDLHERAGKRFMPNRLVLIAFNRFIRNQSSDDVRSVTPNIVRHWVGALTCNARMCRRRLLILRQFFDHLFKLRIIKTSPVTWSLINSYEKVDRTFHPYLFTEEQMRALLEAANRLPRVRGFPLCPEVMHTLMAILYTLGPRINEALPLRLADIDEKQQALLIREAKFHQER